MVAPVGSRTVSRNAPAFIDVEHDGTVHRVALKRVATARRFTLRVRAARRDVVLTLPLRGSSAAARVFAVRHAGWIAERLSALAPGIAFEPGTEIPLRGCLHRLVHRPGLRKRVWSEGDDQPILCVSGPLGQFPDAVRRFLQREARADLLGATSRYAALAGKPIRSVTLRDTRSRWGSCTARGTLNFSWRLILAPPFVLDYLAAHEVAHLVHMNHSAAFWRVVRELVPTYETAEHWLKQHGPTLHRYGP